MQLGSGNFENAAIGDGADAVAQSRRDVEGHAGGEIYDAQVVFVRAGFQAAFAGFKKQRLFFFLVVLKTQTLAGAYDEDFGDVLRGLGPENFVAPGFGNFSFFEQCNS